MGFGLTCVGDGTPIIVIVATIPFWVVIVSITVTVGVSVGGVAVMVVRTVFALFVGTERELICVVGLCVVRDLVTF